MSEKRKKVMGFASHDHDPDLDIYFEYFVGSYRPGLVHQAREWHPAADMVETETCVVLTVEIAGIRREDVELVLEKDALVLQGVRRETLDDDRKRVLAMEIHYGAFRRVFPLPAPVCAEDARADYDRGLLTIRLRKREKPLQRRVKVRISQG